MASPGVFAPTGDTHCLAFCRGDLVDCRNPLAARILQRLGELVIAQVQLSLRILQVILRVKDEIFKPVLIQPDDGGFIGKKVVWAVKQFQRRVLAHIQFG